MDENLPSAILLYDSGSYAWSCESCRKKCSISSLTHEVLSAPDCRIHFRCAQCCGIEVGWVKRRRWHHYGYEKAKTYMADETNVRTKKEFMVWKKAGGPSFIPWSPSRDYKDQWESWPVFLNSRRAPNNIEWQHYQIAMTYTNQLGCQKISAWYSYYDQHFAELIALRIPKHADAVYKPLGHWQGWRRWLGNEKGEL